MRRLAVFASGLVLSLSSVAAQETGMPMAPSADDVPGVKPHRVEATLSDQRWTVVHRAVSADGSTVALGARHDDGWTVVHTLGDCGGAGCSHWRQSVPFETVFWAGDAPTAEAVSARALKGGSLRVIEDVTGRAAIEGRVSADQCADTCEAAMIDRFAAATKAMMDRGDAGPIRSSVGTILPTHAVETGAVPMHHRQVAALVAATERAVKGLVVPSVTAPAPAPAPASAVQVREGAPLLDDRLINTPVTSTVPTPPAFPPLLPESATDSRP